MGIFLTPPLSAHCVLLPLLLLPSIQEETCGMAEMEERMARMEEKMVERVGEMEEKMRKKEEEI